MITGLDIGYGYTKMAVFYGTRLYDEHIFPSRVSRYIPKKSFNESFEIVYVNGRPYIVGSDIEGSSRLGIDFVGTEEYFAVIGYSLSKVDILKRILILGLPPQAYEDEKVTSLKEAIRKIDIKREDGSRVYIPQWIEFVPQGAGIFFAYLTDNGIPDTTKTFVVVDIGYHTMDVVLFTDGKFRAHMSRSYPLGVKALYDMVRDSYIKQYSMFISPDRDEFVEKLLKDGSVSHMGERHTVDVENILNDFYTGRIIKAIGNYISDAEEYGYAVDEIILGGGGISYMGNISGARIVNNPQMANARGFMEYGKKFLDSSL